MIGISSSSGYYCFVVSLGLYRIYDLSFYSVTIFSSEIF